MMDNYLAELAKSRANLLDFMTSLNTSYSTNREKYDLIKKEVEKIDEMIDRVLVPLKPEQLEP
jgi:predicted nuclease with TOPRIM domain